MKSLLELIIKWNGGFQRGGPARFARAVGVESTTVYRWAKRGAIDEWRLKKLSEVLGVTESELRECFDFKPKGDFKTAPGTTISYVPVGGTVSGDSFICACNSATAPVEVLPVMAMKGVSLHAVKVAGAFFGPALATDGDYLAIALGQTTYNDGDLVSVLLGDGKCAIRRIYGAGKSVRLVAAGKAHKDIMIKREALKLEGVVAFIIRRVNNKK